MDEPFETFQHAGMTIKLYQDDSAGDPFEEFDQLADLVWTEREHALKNVNGHVSIDHDHYLDSNRFTSTAHMQRYLTLMERYLVAIPFRLDDYGSSGSRVYTVDADDEHISGFLVVSEKRREELGAPLEGLEENALGDFRQWQAWVEGDVVGYVIETPDGEVVDSCWGFYGEHDYMREHEWQPAAQQAAADYLAEQPRKPIRVELTQKQAASVLVAVKHIYNQNLGASASLQSAHAMIALELGHRERQEAEALAKVREAQQEAAAPA